METKFNKEQVCELDEKALVNAFEVEELEKLTGKTEVEVLLGIGWLLKEGKVKGDGGKVVLA